MWSGGGRLGYNGPGLLNVDTLVVSGSVMMVRMTRGDQAPAPASDTQMESGAPESGEWSTPGPGLQNTSSSQLLPGSCTIPCLGSEAVIIVLSSGHYFANILLKLLYILCQVE